MRKKNLKKRVESEESRVESEAVFTRRISSAVRHFKNLSSFAIGRKLDQTLYSNEKGMTMLAVMAMMAILAVGLLAIAPGVYQSVQREKELESIRRGEEIAQAIELYVDHYRGTKLPDSIDDLLEGLPQGTKKRQILRASSAVDPLSEDGKWRLIGPTDKAFLNFGKRVQTYSNGLLPNTPNKYLNQYAIQFANILNTESEDDLQAPDESEFEVKTDSTQFVGVSSQSKLRSVVTYYGIENHSKWVFTPMFRGGGGTPSRRPSPVSTPTRTRR